MARMYIPFILVLITIVLTDVVLAEQAAIPKIILRSSADEGTKARLLQDSGAVKDTYGADADERAKIPGLSKIAEMTSNFNPYTQKLALKLWLENQTSPKKVFKSLQLKQLRDTGTKLDESPALLEWLRYTMAYRNGGNKWFMGETYLLLTKAATEKELATFFLRLEKVPDLESIGEKLQKTQYDMWHKLGMEPSDIATIMGITERMSPNDPRVTVYFRYTQSWLTKINV